MKYFILTKLLIFTNFVIFAQFSEYFDDGDFSSNPTWLGTASLFQINASNTLQLNDNQAGKAYLITSHGLSTFSDKEWKFKVKQTFSSSGSNNGRVYLSTLASDLTTNPDGIYLQFGEGGANDAIRLIERTSGVDKEILAGTVGAIASSFDIKVRLTYSNTGDWTLYVDPAAGENFVVEATENYSVSSIAPNFGILCNYTSSNSTKFYYDDFYVGDIIVDLTPPIAQTVTVVSANQVAVLFDEPLDQISAELRTNYRINNGILNPSNATLDTTNLALVHLTLSTNLVVGNNYQIEIENVEDVNNNPSVFTTLSFNYLIAETPVKGDVLINEFMCDPTPAQGLPEVEYVEIYNRSAKYFNLENWQIGDASGFGTLPNIWLNPGSYLILVANASLVHYPAGVGVSSFPSLNNSGDDIVLVDSNGVEIDKISYTNNWYKDDVKAGGGFSIERINPTLLCTGISDWQGCILSIGGTPGLENSVFDVSPDLVAPTLVSSFALAPNFVELNFNEGLDSTSIAEALYTFDPLLNVNQLFITETDLNSFTIELQENFVLGHFYDLTIDGISDCNGNTNTLDVSLILPEQGVGNELLINEVLYNPVTGGKDYVELYNNSDSYLDIKDWIIANYDDDTIANISAVPVNYLLAPNDFVVLTEDSTAQLNQYPFAVSGKFIEMDIPSLNNDSSTIYVIKNGIISDKLSYDDDWQFRLLDDSDGKALERFSYTSPTDDQDNWHTAAEYVSFGTPGKENSQVASIDYMGDFMLSSATLSPDNDGFEDVVILTYQMNNPDLLGTVKVYNDKGVEVKVLAENYLLGAKGTFSWDGLNEDNNKVSIGPYIILFSATSISTGEVLLKRKVLTLTQKL